MLPGQGSDKGHGMKEPFNTIQRPVNASVYEGKEDEQWAERGL